MRLARRQLDAAVELVERGADDDVVRVADEWVRRRRPLEAGRLLLAAARGSKQPQRRIELAERAHGLLATAGAVAAARNAQRVLDCAGAGVRGARPMQLVESALFDGVGTTVRDELLQYAVDVRRPAGTILHEPGQGTDHLWLLRAGHVRLYAQTADGRRLTLELVDPGAPLGEHFVVGADEPGTSAEAEDDVVLSAIPIARVARAIERSPRLGANLLAVVGERMVRSRELATRLALWTVDRRLARCILDLDDRYGHPTLDGHRIVNRTLTQVQLAELVSARRETVGELLKRFRAEGLVATRKRRIVILDRGALEAIAGE